MLPRAALIRAPGVGGVGGALGGRRAGQGGSAPDSSGGRTLNTKPPSQVAEGTSYPDPASPGARRRGCRASRWGAGFWEGRPRRAQAGPGACRFAAALG